MTTRRSYILLALILAASAVLHFARIGTPTRTVFDEAYFATYAANDAAHTPYFDIHPPLGKFLFSVPLFFDKGAITNATYVTNTPTSNGMFTTKETNVPYGDFPYVVERGISALFGLLLILAVFLFVREIAGNDAALLAAFFVALENSLLLDTRLILMDGMYLTFGFLSLYFFFKNTMRRHSDPPLAEKNLNVCVPGYTPRDPSSAEGGLRMTRRFWSHNLLFSSLFFGLAMSIKLTAIVFVGPILAYLFFENALRKQKFPWKTLLVFFGIALLLFLVLYIGIENVLFTPHEQLSVIGTLFNLPNAVQNPSIFKATFYQLYVGTSGYVSGGTNPMMSPWYAWPFMFGAMHFMYGPAGGYLPAGAQITLIGNPFVWLLSTFAILLVLWNSALIIAKRLPSAGEHDMPIAILFGGYAISLIPFFTIVHRATYLYHYFPSLLFAIALAAILIVRALRNKTMHAKVLILGAIGILSVWGFILVAPYTYGL